MVSKISGEKRNPLGGMTNRASTYVENLIDKKPRKRRSDAVGRKSDYHRDTGVLTVRLPAAQVEQCKSRAAAKGLSVSAWLAALVQADLGEDD